MSQPLLPAVVLVPVQPGDGRGGDALHLPLGGWTWLCTHTDSGGAVKSTKVFRNKVIIRCIDIVYIFRYFDICSGLVFFLSFLSLQVGTVRQSLVGVRLFFILSSGTVVIYWVWMGYLRWGEGENEASKEV